MFQSIFDNWEGVLRIAISTILAYFSMIIILRISGKRTLAKMNAFDFIVTIALGSMLGGLILNKSIPLVEGIVAMTLLVFLQYMITYFSVRNKSFKNLVSSSPTLLLYKGELLHTEMKKERITETEIKKAAREAGVADLSGIDAIVLEATGDITVIKKANESEHRILSDIGNLPGSA